MIQRQKDKFRLHIPEAQPAQGGGPVDKATSVTIECEDLCPRYIARVIKGIKVGPSPEWMQQRLQTLPTDLPPETSARLGNLRDEGRASGSSLEGETVLRELRERFGPKPN